MTAPRKSGKSAKTSAKRRFFDIILWLSLTAVMIMGLTVVQVAFTAVFNPPCTMHTLWQSLGGANAPHCHWRRLEAISPHLQRAVLAAEDQRFFIHQGFDTVEIKNALETALTTGKVRGASTITMQAARSVFLFPSRSAGRKLAEAWYTVLMEGLLSKKRILELYLNTVDWGDDIMGAEAAARAYFKTGAASLTPGQAALLAAILPSPHRWSPLRPSRHVQARKARILKDMPAMQIPWAQALTAGPVAFAWPS